MKSLIKLRNTEDKTHNMLFSYSENYKRDCEILIDMYINLFKYKMDVPCFSEIFERVEAYNIGIATDIAKESLKPYQDEPEFIEILNNDINNNLLDIFSGDLYQTIYGILYNLNIVFVNDYENHPLYEMVRILGSEYRVLTNSGIQIMFPLIDNLYSLDSFGLECADFEDLTDSYIQIKGDDIPCLK